MRAKNRVKTPRLKAPVCIPAPGIFYTMGLHEDALMLRMVALVPRPFTTWKMYGGL